MALQKMTKDHFPLSFGVFKPVGHVVIAVRDDAAARSLSDALGEEGFADDEVLCFTAAEMAHHLQELLPGVGTAAGFGSEIQSMRQYERMARHEGRGWVVVFSPDDEAHERIRNLAASHGATLVNKYNRLTVEELL